MTQRIFYFFSLLFATLIIACNNNVGDNTAVTTASAKTDSAPSCMKVPSRFGINTDTANILYRENTSVGSMVRIPGGIFEMGGDNNQASPDEYSKHKVQVSPFYMDVTEVTNAEFKKFIDATGYKTTAEKKPDWEELKKTVPPNTPKPPDSLLVAASLVFKPSNGPVDLMIIASGGVG